MTEIDHTQPLIPLVRYIPVLDHGFVRLEEWMGSDAAVVRAARICYASEPSGPEADTRLIRHLLWSDPQHNTPIEHAVFRFHARAPLFTARQWMRHRVGTFDERSLRYVRLDENAHYYTPQGLSPAAEAHYREQVEAALKSYQVLLLLKMPPEQARGVVPMCIYTEFVWTVNAWSAMNFLEKRLDKAAQQEIREYAQAVLRLMSGAMPVTMAAWKKATGYD